MPQAALSGIKVFDMTRVLAGPTCTQILGDLGAEVTKIEQPGVGDVTRTWGPPFEMDESGHPTSESAYYISCNRNKKSLELDFTTKEGQAQAIAMIQKSDILVENFKVGTLKKYGLDYDSLKVTNPRLIYCSITGFGQTGPYAERPGYDFQVQGMSGLMSLNGEKDGPPLRAGISLADISTGVYSALAIMTALYHREKTGAGQHIDMALLDCQMAMLSFAAQSYLLDGQQPLRVGNGHPNIVPYGAFEASDGFVIIAIGTDQQFMKFCGLIERPSLVSDPRFMTNKDRVKHREILNPIINDITKEKPRVFWIESLDKLGVPAGPVNSLDEAFSNPQVIARGIKQSIAPNGLNVIASPIRLSNAPVEYKSRPPKLGEI